MVMEELKRRFSIWEKSLRGSTKGFYFWEVLKKSDKALSYCCIVEIQFYWAKAADCGIEISSEAQNKLVLYQNNELNA